MNGIKTQLATITGLKVTEYKATQINPPQAIVGLPSIPDYHGAFAHGHLVIEPTVTILVSKDHDRIGQTLLAGYANPTGATSVHAAIEADKTLGGTVDNCIVVSFQEIDETVGGIDWYAGVWKLKVTASGA